MGTAFRQREAAPDRADEIEVRVRAKRREVLRARPPYVEDDLDRRRPPAALVDPVDGERATKEERPVRSASDVDELARLDLLADIRCHDR
jgi:hypothetical protein